MWMTDIELEEQLEVKEERWKDREKEGEKEEKRKLNERGGEEIREVRKWNSIIMQMDITTELEDKYYYIFCM